MGNEKITIKLEHPVTFADELVHEVHIRRPKGKDLKGLKNIAGSHDDQLMFMARLIDQPVAFVGEIDMATDLMKIMEKVMNFLPDSPQTS